MAPYIEDITVRFDAFPDVEVKAEVQEIGREASATTRTYPVTLVMDQPEGVSILPGMAGRAQGTPRPPDGEKRMSLVIPVTAVFADVATDTSAVWVIDESTGHTVEEGLEPGELIATAGVTFLKEGQIVVPELQ